MHETLDMRFVLRGRRAALGMDFLSSHGLTRAIGAIYREAHWTTYYKLI